MGSSTALFAQSVDENYVDGQLLISLNPEVYAYSSGLDQVSEILLQHEVTFDRVSQPFAFSLSSEYWGNFFLIEFSDAEAIANYQEQMLNLEEVTEVFRVPLVKTSQLANPNDPDYLNGLQQPLSVVQTQTAWSLVNPPSGTGPDVVVAVIDDAIDLSHPDLATNLWFSGDPVGTGDDNNNGFVDDTHGYDFGDNDGDPSVPASAGPNFFEHGTHVAGIANAVTNNNTGISSLAYNVKLMSLKCASDQSPNPRQFSILAVINGINYAVDNGADIINMSLGTTSDFPPLEVAVNNAHNQDVIVVAAAGNNSTDAPSYPAAYTNAIAVAASDNYDLKAGFSNYGTWVDITAPGVNIHSTLPNNNYGAISGTSMACPLVASALALMKQHRPNVPSAFLVDCLLNNTDNIDPLHPTSLHGMLGSGRLNANLAIQCMNGIIANIQVDELSPCLGQTVTFTASPNTGSNITYSWDFGDNSTPFTSTSNTVTYTYNGVFAPATVTLTVTDGTSSATDQIDLVVSNCQLDIPTQAHWYFGSQLAVDFSNGLPQADLSACQNGTMAGAKEVAASISDANANLLFYTDGERVWNNNHVQVNSTLLICSYSMSNGVIITPIPGSTDNYYIFHTDADTPGGGNRGLHYSEVNTTGGTITMTSTNNPITQVGYVSSPLGALLTAERITVVPSCNGYWLITTAYTGSEMHVVVFDVSATGIQFASSFNFGTGQFRDFDFGYLKASPDGESLAYTIDNGPSSGIHLMDFDPITGTITNRRHITNQASYGVAFSPNSQILYTNRWYQGAGIFQYDLTQATPVGTDITASLSTAQSFAGIQLGPDGKIYLKQISHGHPHLSTIHFPDQINQPGFVYNDVDLNPTNQSCVVNFPPQNFSFNLPNFIDAKPVIIEADTFTYTVENCTRYDFTGPACSSTWAWNFDDPTSGNNTASTQSASHTFSAPGTYTVSLTTDNHTITETITISNPAVQIVGDQSLCYEDGGIYSYFADAGMGQYSYAWSISGGTILTDPAQALVDVEWSLPIGQLSVIVTDANTGCTGTDSFNLINDCETTCDNCTQTNNEVVNGDFEQGASGVGTFISQLQVQNQMACNTVGTYLIGAEAQDKCFTLVDDLWDHTVGTRDGHYMIIDDHLSLNGYYVWAQQSINIVQGEIYHFSFWHMRNLTAARPGWYQEFVLVANGHIIDTISTQGAPANQWVEYCADWVSDQTTTQAVIGIARINNNGNNLPYGIDDITFGTCVDCNITADFNTGLHTIDDPWRSFFDQSTTSGTVISWQWDFGDPNSGIDNTSTFQNPWHRFTTDGTFNVCLTVTAIQGGRTCTTTICKPITIYREKVPLPCDLEPAFDVDFKFRNDCSVTLNDQSSIVGGNITQWNWNVYDQNGALLFNSNQPNVTFNRNFGSYVKVCLEVTGNNGGCFAQTCREWSHLGACSITDPGPVKGMDAQLMMFPNPTEHKVQVDLALEVNPEQVQLTDVSGYRINVDIKQKSAHQLLIDLSGQRSGLYYLIIRTKEGVINRTIIKQ